jgi:hypothetical protein
MLLKLFSPLLERGIFYFLTANADMIVGLFAPPQPSATANAKTCWTRDSQTLCAARIRRFKWFGLVYTPQCFFIYSPRFFSWGLFDSFTEMAGKRKCHHPLYIFTLFGGPSSSVAPCFEWGCRCAPPPNDGRRTDVVVHFTFDLII